MKHKKEKQPALDELIKERNALLLSKDNPKRLRELQSKIDYIEYGLTDPT